MRNKGAVVILTLIITLLCIYYLSFTFVSRGIQKDAITVATDESGIVDLSVKQRYLDSVWNEPVYNLLGAEYTFKEVKDTELNLGLDLQGGMHAVLEVSPVDILKGLSGNNEDEDFLAAIAKARELQKTSQGTFSDLFYTSYKEISPDGRLAEIFANSSNQGRISFNSSDNDVMKMINEEINDAIDRSFNILRTRIDRFGTSQPNIQLLPGSGRIQVEIPGADNPERVRKLLQNVAKLEFWEVGEPNELNNTLVAINTKWTEMQKAKFPELDLGSEDQGEADAGESLDDLLSSSQSDSLGTRDDLESQLADNSEDSVAAQEALDSLLQTEVSPLFAYTRSQWPLLYDVKDTSKVIRMLQNPEIAALIPRTYKIAWDNKGVESETSDEELITLHFLKVGRGGKAPLEGDVITDARQSIDQYGKPAVSMQMNAIGAKKWRRLTGENVNRRIAIVLDSYVYSAPNVIGEIPNGSSEITGNFTLEEAKDLANVLKAGSLPAPTRIVEEAIVGPTLGQVAQNQGIISIVSGILIVTLFMVAYYSKGGFIANFALVFNIFFIMGILAQLNAALTLPGIAGIVLTIGMSIDANVLIFERIREEMRRGVNLKEAISLGYKKAHSSIIDANVTTFLTAVILYSLGQGPVKGFAVTLMIGIASSFFSAVYITRVIIEQLTRKGEKSNFKFNTPLSKGLLSNLGIDFLSMRKKAYVFSLIVITTGLILISMNGLNLGVDFKGGRSYVVSFGEPVIATDLRTGLSSEFEGSSTEVKNFGSNSVMKVTTSYRVDDESDEADLDVRTALISGLTNLTGKSYIDDDEDVGVDQFAISSSAKVGATIADDIKNASIQSILFSLVVIFLYILVRFRRWQFGLGAIVALFHDTLVVLSAFAIAGLFGFSFEVDQVFIAAMLTIIGYSINDTVIVFDRIRENLQLKTSDDQFKVFNMSINGTLNRTVITSITTLIVITILLVFGGAVLRGFSFALFIGVLVGTYSSIFIATPVVIDLRNKETPVADKKKVRSKGTPVPAHV
jgi:SecD/SecF fusion protein